MAFLLEEFKSAEAFLDALARRDSRWAPSPLDWIFRGQANAQWTLTPSALRPVTFRYGQWDEFGIHSMHGHQVYNEAQIIRSFLIAVDRQGLALPGETAFRWIDHVRMFDEVERLLEHGEWPPHDLAPLFALAQHHGVPTRLLDWTERPLIAAYFAAVGAAQLLIHSPEKPERLAVWALNITDVRILLGDSNKKKGAAPALRFIRTPRASNPNLRAQEGVFTVLVDRFRKAKDSSEFPPLDAFIQNYSFESVDKYFVKFPVMRKLELPAVEAGKLLRLLSDEWVSAMHLYPGIDGVVQGLREHALWDSQL